MPYNDKARQAQWNRDNYRRTAEAKKHAKSRPCADCGVQYPYYVMQFDHLRDKKYQISRMRSHSVKTTLSEIEKCDVVCSNCHAERSHSRSVAVNAPL